LKNRERDLATELVVISGISGAGKTTALGALEDAGYFCMDNIPPALLIDLLSLMDSSLSGKKIATVVDVRAGSSLVEIKDVLKNLKAKGLTVKLIFLDSKDDVLVNRYNLTRRRHPLADEGNQSIDKLIKKERDLLSDIKEISDYIVDTSLISTHQLRSELLEIVEGKSQRSLKIFIESFGFKYGIPLSADFIFDARFLPNPYYVEALSDKTGNDPEVIEYLENFAVVGEYLSKIVDVIKIAGENYSKEGKNSLYVAIGCSGGRHRSVYIANKLFSILKDKVSVNVSHRDIER
jgi:UPF0042 nucleotide-binding protein